jgi:hypothetical protein
MSAIVLKARVQAESVDALNRVAKATVDLANGSAVTLAWSATAGDEVFTATAATTGLEFAIGRKDPFVIAAGSMLEDEHKDAWYLEVTSNSGVWMAISPEVNKDVIGQTYISYNDLELKVGDIVLYIKALWNGGATVALGQVEELKGVRVKVMFEDNKTSNIAPDNLFVITDSRIREVYKWLK